MAPDESWLYVGEGVRRMRKLRGWTISELSALSGLSPNAISLVERGHVAPTVATLCRLAATLGVKAGSLFEGFCRERAPRDAPLNDARQIVVCLSGALTCETATATHSLSSGDSLSLPDPGNQRWGSATDEAAVAIMILLPRTDCGAHS